jgi:hypothetical protein
MLKSYGALFAHVTGTLAELEAEAFRLASVSGDQAIGARESIMGRTRVLFSAISREARSLGLQATEGFISRHQLDVHNVILTRDLQLMLKELRGAITDELEWFKFLSIARRDAELYEMAEPFGANVAAKFPRCAEDVRGAAQCLALDQPTAAVFHLMRTMETGVQTLGKKLKIGINPLIEPWHQFLLHVDKAVQVLPSKTARQKQAKAAYAGVSAHLGTVRLAWRNEVMHPKQTYTAEEARRIFEAARGFMDHLSDLI